ncbi:two component transcriptional regulator, LuxR family [Filimonas lacunae]|uniref:Two component transcriptional regulator, LuxR family n=1 Tax=Filimonas lacunae TaxID=477680 RepID=A0A173MMC4_9BACT|nr:response regulator transcription factor [Filimonas lacunae]BAV08636.1 two-component transcriptional regulator, LuxR family [Filimonas lacunae]SIS58944.1 two component transcriptional regulator, LuxR family [Filimonas lacunae]
MIRISMADDHIIVLSGFQKIVAEANDITIIGTYTNGDDLLKDIPVNKPDILILDIQMPGKNGIELASVIRKKYPEIKIIVLSSVEVLAQVKKILQLGCMGYLLKNIDSNTFLTAIRTVYNNEQFIHEELRKHLVNNLFTPAHFVKITRREKEILQLIAQEMTTQEIADKLFLSTHTIVNHRNSLLQKLNVKNTAGLMMKAVEEGLL